MFVSYVIRIDANPKLLKIRFSGGEVNRESDGTERLTLRTCSGVQSVWFYDENEL